MCALDFRRVVVINWVVVVICQNVCPRFWPGGGNWVVVVICKNVCPRFSPGGGNWVVVIKSGKDGVCDIEHITIFL